MGELAARYQGIQCLTSFDFASAFAHIGRRQRERVVLVGTDAKGRLLRVWQSKPGTADEVSILAEDLYQMCTPEIARVCILHNHPSRSVTPSPGDVELTRVALRIFDANNVQVVDHLIITKGGGFFSFKAAFGVKFDTVGEIRNAR